MSTMRESEKVSTATRSAAEMSRCAVPKAGTFLRSGVRPPSAKSLASTKNCQSCSVSNWNNRHAAL